MKPVLRIQPRLHPVRTPESAQTHNAPSGAVLEGQGGPVAGAGSEVVKKGGGVEGESLTEAVPQVVQAIGQISNYFGASGGQASGQHVSGHQPETPGQPYENVVSCEGTKQSVGVSDEPVSKDQSAEGQSASKQASTTIGHLSHDAIGQLAGEIAQNLKGNAEKASKDVATTEVPSYAPEKCITTGYSDGQDPGKGSPHKNIKPALDKTGGNEVRKLEGMLVSEREIFGAQLAEEESFSDDSAEGGVENIGGEGGHGDIEGSESGGGMGEGLWEDVAVGEDVASNKVADNQGSDGGNHGNAPLSSSQTEMMEEFKKLTSLPRGDQPSLGETVQQLLG